MSERLNKKNKLRLSDIWIKGKTDATFFLLLLIILTIGLIMLFSASYVSADIKMKNSYYFIMRQGLIALAGLFIMWVVSHISYKFIRKFAVAFYLFMVGFLAMMLILPPMKEGTSVKRWFIVGSFNFQPSELAKFAVILIHRL